MRSSQRARASIPCRRGRRWTPPCLCWRERTGHPYGFMDPAQWRAYAGWMAEHDLISSAPKTSDVLTNELLP